MNKTLDKTNLQIIRNKLQEHLDAFDFHGLNCKLGNCSYNSDNATFKLEVAFEGADSKQMSDLKRYADYFDIDVNRKSEKYSLVGYAPRSRKYPWLVTVAGRDGTFKIDDDTAKRHFGKVA